MEQKFKHSSLPYWLVTIPLLVLVFAGYWALVERAYQLRSLAQKERAARLLGVSVHLERELTKELDEVFEIVSRSEDLDELDLPPWRLAVLVYDKSGLLYPKVDYDPIKKESEPTELSQWQLRAERFEQEEGSLRQALLSYQQAALVASSNGARALALVGSIRCLQKLKEYDRAVKEANRLVELYGSLASPLGVSYRLLAQELIVSLHVDRARRSLTDFNKAGRVLLKFMKDITLNNHGLSEEDLGLYENILTDLLSRLETQRTENKASQDEIFNRAAFWLSTEARSLRSAPWQTFTHKHSLKGNIDESYLVATRYGRQTIVLYVDGRLMAKELNELIGGRDLVVRVQKGGHHLLPLWGLVIEAPLVQGDPSGFTASLSLLALLTLLATTGIFVLRSRTTRAYEIAHERSAFLARFSHELKTPLTSMRLLTEGMVEGRVTDKEKQENHLRLIAQESARLERLLQNVFLYSRQSTDEKEELNGGREQDLDELVQESLSLFAALYGNERFNYEPSCEPLTIRVDSDGLKRAIINLVDNALRYSPEGESIEIVTKRDGDTCVLTIRDHGPGISRSDEENIFKPFFSTEKTNNGLGLGLHICHQIVGRNGGKVSFEKPTHGQGAAFSITLPLSREWMKQ